MKKINRFLLGMLAALTALVMVGCHYNENPTRTSLNIDTSVLVLDLGQSVTRKASSKASGAVFTYKSSNPYVANVEADGTVYAVSEGECIITVSMAENLEDWYAASQVQYKVVVDDFVNIVPESAKGPTPTPVPDPSPTPDPSPSPTPTPKPTPYIPVPDITPPVATPYTLDIDYDNVAIGQVICLVDGNIARNYDVDKVPSGSVKVAMIAYLGAIDGYCANGLAISLTPKDGMSWNEARIAWPTKTLPIFINAGWTLPSTEAYARMIKACGGRIPNQLIGDEPDLNTYRVVDELFKAKLKAASGVDEPKDIVWTITAGGSNKIWVYNMGTSLVYATISLLRNTLSYGVLRF